MCADNGHSAKNTMLDLHVYGTTDILAKNKIMRFKVKTLTCPCDSTYTKKVRVLGKTGIRLLKVLRAKRAKQCNKIL